MLFGHVAALVDLGQNSYRAARTELGREGRLRTLLGRSAFGPGMAVPAPKASFGVGIAFGRVGWISAVPDLRCL